MDKKKILMAGAAMVALSPLAAKEVKAASANITARAIILQAINVAQVQNLDFGTFSVTGAGGNIVIAPVGADTIPGTINQIATSTPNEAVFSIQAATGFPIDVSVGATSITLTNGTNNLTVNAFNILTDAGGTAGTLTLALATENYPVGATLIVPAAPVPAGTYTGTFTVNASYQ